MTDGNSEIMLAIKSGRAIRFPEEKVRSTGRGGIGVYGIEVDDEKDEVVGMVCVNREDKTRTILVVSDKGYGKRTFLDDPETGEATIVSPGTFSDTHVAINMTTGCCSAAANVSLCYPFTIQNLRSSFNGVSDGYQQWTLTWRPVAGTIAIIETQCTSAFSPDSSLISCPSTVSYGTDGASAIVIIPPAPPPPAPPPNVYPNPRAVLTLLCSSYTASATIRLLS
jgi:hypothetical protein